MAASDQLSDLTLDERALLSDIAVAWNRFLSLPRQHQDETDEFRHAIHALQVMVMARPVERALAAETA